ncbi:MAG: hypothetical protein R6V07_00155 [Armatimonadota bacterium]
MGFDSAVASSALEYLDREALLRGVLLHLRREELPPDAPMGRYDFIWRAIAPELGETASVDEWQLEESRVNRAWRRTCKQHAQTLSFWHGLAVVHREWALEAEEREDGDWEIAARYWRLSTGVMRHLLVCPDFWELASTDGEMSDPEQLAAVRNEMCTRIIDQHLDRANQYRQTNMEAARLHAGCLRMLANLDLDEPQEDTGVTPVLPVDDELVGEVQRSFNAALDNWASQWLFRAEQILIDANRIANQPSGIKRAYPDAIDHMMEFLDLVPDNERGTLFVVRQYNTWAEDAFVVDRDGLYEEVVAHSEEPASFLAEVTARGEGGAPANVALCKRLVFAALTGCDAEQKIDYLREALNWNPGDREATRLLEQAKDLSISEELNEANDLVEEERYQEAEEKLSALEADVGETLEGIKQIRAKVFFQQAEKDASEYRFKAASEKMEQARELVPHVEVVVERADLFRELASEADELRAFLTARDALEDNDIVRAVRLTESIAPDFSRYGEVRRLRAACMFREAIRRANDLEQFEAASALMDTVVELDPREAIFQEQRDACLRATAGYLFAQACEALERDDFPAAGTLLRRAADYADGEEKTLLLDQAEQAFRREREKPHLDTLEKAHGHMQREEFGRALVLLESIPTSFSQSDAVRHLMWQACLAEAMRLAGEGELTRAMSLVEQARANVDSDNMEVVERCERELSMAAEMGAARDDFEKGVSMANRAIEQLSSGDVSALTELLEARELLQHAQRKAPNVSQIKEQLDALDRIIEQLPGSF